MEMGFRIDKCDVTEGDTWLSEPVLDSGH